MRLQRKKIASDWRKRPLLLMLLEWLQLGRSKKDGTRPLAKSMSVLQRCKFSMERQILVRTRKNHALCWWEFWAGRRRVSFLGGRQFSSNKKFWRRSRDGREGFVESIWLMVLESYGGGGHEDGWATSGDEGHLGGRSGGSKDSRLGGWLVLLYMMTVKDWKVTCMVAVREGMGVIKDHVKKCL